MASARKARDVFLSHSSRDKDAALEIYNRLTQVGYSCWLDEVDILVGEDIIDKVYEGIHDSRFLVILLSRSSVQSTWVRQELNAARLREIESGATRVLPALLEDCDIPDAIRTKRYADLREGVDRGLRELLESIAILSQVPTREALSMVDRSQPASDLPRERAQALLNTCREALAVAEWREGEAYKDVLIAPVPVNKARIALQDIPSFVDANTVELRRYGGAPFPYSRTLPGAQARARPNGYAVFDAEPWPYRDWSFELWFMMPDGTLFWVSSHLWGNWSVRHAHEGGALSS